MVDQIRRGDNEEATKVVYSRAVSEPPKQSESSKQLAAAEQQAKDRFEKAMTELREGAYRFSSRARGQSELIIEELVDPEGETVKSLAEHEGDVGALAL